LTKPSGFTVRKITREDALKVYTTVDDPTGKAATLMNLGRAYVAKRDWNAAQSKFGEALAMYANMKDNLGSGLAQALIADVESEQAQYEVALKGYNTALGFLKKTDNVLEIPKIYNKIGLIYTKTGDYKNAVANFDKALEVERANNFKSGIAETQVYKGTALLTMGEFDTADSAFDEAMRIYTEQDNKAGIAEARVGAKR
jgi:tetratricopeptide (TPR) repeat protein